MRALLLIFALFSCMAVAQEPNADPLLKAAIDAQQRGDFPEAIRDYHRFLAKHPGAVEAEVNLGAALAHEGQFDEAIAVYRAALPSIQDQQDKNAVVLNLALAYYKKADWQNAHTQFQTLHNARPDDARIALLLGDCDLHLGKPADAMALLMPLEAANAENPDFDFVLASALIKSNKLRDGALLMEKSADLGNSADAYMIAGSTQLQLNEFAKARHDLDTALRLNPSLPGINTLAGKARDLDGDAEAAEPAFQEAVKLNPNDFDANLYLGAILYKQRHLPEAKIYLDRALQLNPSSSMARYEVAMLESATGQEDDAAQKLEKLIQDDPDWLEPHVELAALYYRLHRPADGARERKIVERLTAAQQAKGPQQ
ncbi:tetratricopeptide repeat protein [Edaphobacter paludis]|uniref:Tetratricopeptide repeat protein n=1 Tax=Edaphobacter paludis TaxID=3035702 RepID=A0AAU7D4J2_9BACT